MIDVSTHRQALADRIAVVTSLIDETHPTPPAIGPISREARGLAVVLLFAAYEDLLKSLTRTLLEAVVSMRISNSRLSPGFRVFAIRDAARSLRDVSERKLFETTIPKIVELVERSDRVPTLNTSDFPSDGSFMKRSQIEFWARTFQTGPPVVVLQRVWNNIDAVVAQRNAVAHGSQTPQDVGRNYTEGDIRRLTADWASDWDAFLVHVEALAGACGRSRDCWRARRSRP